MTFAEPFVTDTTDWLKRRASIVLECEDLVHPIGYVVVLASALEQARELSEPSTLLYEQLHRDLALLSPQVTAEIGDTAFGRWLQIAAVAEYYEELDLAWLMVARLHTLVTDGSSGNREYAAVCCARLGRIARTVGALEDASHWYVDALTKSDRESTDARYLALIGLSLLAVGRGNFPEGARHASAVLRTNASAPIHRVQAHQILVFLHRRKGHLLDALLHAWHAYDLLGQEDFRRKELVIAMSEIALEWGDIRAAEHGFAFVVSSDVPDRVLIPALAGLLRAISATYTASEASHERAAARHRLLEHRRTLNQLQQRASSPSDRIIALLAIAEIAALLGEHDDACHTADEAESLAEQHGFHEKAHAADALRSRLDAARALRDRSRTFDTPRTAFRVPRGRARVALDRLATVGTTDGLHASLAL